jgi:hypothetical protein
MPDRFSGRVLLPECGEGVYLQVTFPAAAALEADLGEFIFVDKLVYGLPRLSPKMLTAMLSHCAFGADGKAAQAVWPDDVPLETLANKCLDALSLGLRGKTHAEWVDEIEGARAKATGQNPTDGTAV